MPTPCVTVVFDRTGEVAACVADVASLEARLTAPRLRECAGHIQRVGAAAALRRPCHFGLLAWPWPRALHIAVWGPVWGCCGSCMHGPMGHGGMAGHAWLAIAACAACVHACVLDDHGWHAGGAVGR